MLRVIGEQLSDALHLMELAVLVRNWFQGLFQPEKSVRNDSLHPDSLPFELGYPRQANLLFALFDK